MTTSLNICGVVVDADLALKRRSPVEIAEAIPCPTIVFFDVLTNTLQALIGTDALNDPVDKGAVFPSIWGAFEQAVGSAL